MSALTVLLSSVSCCDLPSKSSPSIFMSSNSFTTTVGTNEIGFFIGDDDCRRIQFNREEMDALIIGRVYAQDLADAFANFVSATFASGEIPSCFRQDLSPGEVKRIQEELPVFQRNFGNAFFNLILIFEY